MWSSHSTTTILAPSPTAVVKQPHGGISGCGGDPGKPCTLWLNFSSNLRMLRSEGGIYLTWKHAASVVNLVGLVTSTSKLSCLPGPNFLNLSPPNATSCQCSLNHLLHPATWWHQAVQQSQRPAPGYLGCFEYKLSPCPQDLVCRKQISQTMTTQHLQASDTHLLKEKRNSLVLLSTWGHTLPEGLCECRLFAKRRVYWEGQHADGILL